MAPFLVTSVPLPYIVREGKLEVFKELYLPKEPVKANVVSNILRELKLIRFEPLAPGKVRRVYTPPITLPCGFIFFERHGYTTQWIDDDSIGRKTLDQIGQERGVPPGYVWKWVSVKFPARTINTMKIYSGVHGEVVPSPVHRKGIVYVGFLVPESEMYTLIRHDERVGPNLFVIGHAPGGMSAAIRDFMAPYVSEPLDSAHMTSREQYSYIPLRQGEFHQATMRFNRSFLVEESSMDLGIEHMVSELTPYIMMRSEYNSLLESMDTRRWTFPHYSNMNNDVFSMDVDEQGRVWLGYHATPASPTSLFPYRRMHILHQDNPDHRTLPGVVYERESMFFKSMVESPDVRVQYMESYDQLRLFLTAVSDNLPVPHLNRVEGVSVPSVDWLFQFQQEGVQAMIQHERHKDGYLGLVTERISGRAGSPGIFRSVDDIVWGQYVDNDDLLKTTIGILADEPGLGKTRQIAGLCRYGGGTTLIVCPSSILSQWVREIREVWPGARVCEWYARKRQQYELATVAGEYDIVITTYTTATRYVTDIRTVDQWHRVVLDESHAMPSNFVVHPLKARHYWCVTGTPEVHFYSRTAVFLARRVPAVFSLQPFDMQLHLRYGTRKNLRDVWRLFRPIVFRRTKRMHVLLPDVTSETTVVDLSHDEMQQYTQIMQEIFRIGGRIATLQASRYYQILTMACSTGQMMHDMMRGLQRRVVEPTRRDTYIHPSCHVPGDEKPGDEDMCPICCDAFEQPVRTLCRHWFCEECILMALQSTYIRHKQCPMCRQVIDPGGLLRVEPPQQEEEENREDREEDTSQPMDVEEEPRAPESTKIRTVVRDVRDFLESSNNKILVFFTGSAMMHAYSEAFEAAGISHEAVDGRTSIPRRSRLFQSFQEEQGDDACRVLLLTTRVAAAGITLTAANIVLCVSPSIPKGLEDQMVGRANRIGQTQAVLFRRYVAGRTIEAAVAQRDEMSYALLGDMLTTQRLESRR